jgi:hypothetical protein
MTAREQFMGKWGINREEELRDIITILEMLMGMQFRRLRRKRVQEFSIEVIEAIEGTPTWNGHVYG